MDVKDHDLGLRRIVLDANPASALSALTRLLGGLAAVVPPTRARATLLMSPHLGQLNGKPQPTSQSTLVGDAGQQGQFVGGQRPVAGKSVRLKSLSTGKKRYPQAPHAVRRAAGAC
jgi:hypothetical protein